jgi:hypothetical protein
MVNINLLLYLRTVAETDDSVLWMNISPSSECCILSFGWYPGLLILSLTFLNTGCSIFIGGVRLHHLWRWKTQSVAKRRQYILDARESLKINNETDYFIVKVISTDRNKLLYKNRLSISIFFCSLQEYVSRHVARTEEPRCVQNVSWETGGKDTTWKIWA